MAWLVGLSLAPILFALFLGVQAAINYAQCHGEYRPFLGSTKQAFAVYGCPLRDAGPLIDLKKRLGIYNPHWMTVIK